MTIPARLDGVVVVIPWPSGATARARARLAGVPRLLVVDDGAAPPTDCQLDEDWTASAAPPADVAARCTTLAARPSGPRHTALASVAEGLADHPVVVLDALVAHWPRAAPRTALREHLPTDHHLAATLGELREALAPLGYEVLAVAGGALLARTAVTAAGR